MPDKSVTERLGACVPNLVAWRGNGHLESCGCAICDSITELRACIAEIEDVARMARKSQTHRMQQFAARLAKEETDAANQS